jgi:hypothetical protein
MLFTKHCVLTSHRYINYFTIPVYLGIKVQEYVNNQTTRRGPFIFQELIKLSVKTYLSTTQIIN